MNLLTLITPTGGRPEAFALCEKYMKRQTYKGKIQWIVIDDMPEKPTKITMGQDYGVGPMLWREGINTQRPNMDIAFKRIKGDAVLIIEDDDWYHPRYIELMVSFLEKWPVVGECNSKYYNIQSRSHREMLNYRHVSLCQTGIRREAYPLLEQAIHSGELYFDIAFWAKVRTTFTPNFKFLDLNLCIGMKGLPGKGGIGVGHVAKDFLGDPNFAQLKKWIGEDTQDYIALSQKKVAQ